MANIAGGIRKVWKGATALVQRLGPKAIVKAGANDFRTIYRGVSGSPSMRSPEGQRSMAKAALRLYGGLTLATYGARAMHGQPLAPRQRGGLTKKNYLPLIPGI